MVLMQKASPSADPDFTKHLKSVTIVICLSSKYIHQNKLFKFEFYF